jgi:hypothetical protein
MYQHLLEQVGRDSRTKSIILCVYLTTDFKYLEHVVEMMHLYKLQILKRLSYSVNYNKPVNRINEY